MGLEDMEDFDWAWKIQNGVGRFRMGLKIRRWAGKCKRGLGHSNGAGGFKVGLEDSKWCWTLQGGLGRFKMGVEDSQ